MEKGIKIGMKSVLSSKALYRLYLSNKSRNIYSLYVYRTLLVCSMHINCTYKYIHIYIQENGVRLIFISVKRLSTAAGAEYV